MKTVSAQILEQYQNTNDIHGVVEGQAISKVNGRIDIYRFRDGSEIEHNGLTWRVVPNEQTLLYQAMQSLEDTKIAMSFNEFDV